MDFATLPPEVNSGRMYAGPGAGSMLAAATMWDELATELHAAAANSGSVISMLTSGPWIGPSSASMATAAAAQTAWLSTTAAEAEQTGAQAKAAAAAHAAAFAMTVPPWVVAANRAQLMALIATNLFGQNTPAIMTTEAEYAEMWAQDASAMYGYATASAAATSQMTPFASPPQLTNPGGIAAQTAAVAQATGAPAGHTQTVLSLGQLMSAVPQALQELASPSTGSSSTELATVVSAITAGGPLPQAVSNAATLSSFGTLPGILSCMWATTGSSWGVSALAAAPAAAIAHTPGDVHFVTPAATQAGTDATLAGAGKAASIGGLSVPQSWTTAAPAMHLAAAESPSASFVALDDASGLFGSMPLFGGAPLMTLTGRGIADSRERKPTDKTTGASPADRKIAKLLARQQAERLALAAELEAELLQDDKR